MTFKTCIRLAVCMVLFAALGFSQAAAPTLTSTASTAAIAPLPVHALFAGVGISTGLPAQHAVGSAAYLQQADTNLYAFARYDILGINKKPFSLQTVVTAGACEVTHQFGTVFFVGACLDGGTAVSGGNIGGAIGADGLAGIRFGSKKNFGFVVMGGVVKTALSSNVTPIRAGFVYGF